MDDPTPGAGGDYHYEGAVAMRLIREVLKEQDLVRLVQPDKFVGWVYGIDYEHAHVMTNDLWKAQVNGIPHNCFLVSTAFDPNAFDQSQNIDREVILLRVIGSAKLPHDDDLIRTKIEHFQDRQHPFDEASGFDEITLNQIQFGGLKCRILGTFYMHANRLWLGSDIESFSQASRLLVYRPTGDALSTIINHIDPVRHDAMRRSAEELGFRQEIEPIPIGVVRYTSTDRLHRKEAADEVPVYLHPVDFLARRTAVLGMTRTGKSNTIKHTVAMVKRISDDSGMPIGQIIFDINGEYANANQQDKGAISEVYPEDTVRYRGVETEGFLDLRNNFYDDNLTPGLHLLQSFLRNDLASGQQDMKTFLSLSLEEPDKTAWGDHNRWQVRRALYLCVLHNAGFSAPTGFKVRFPAGQAVRNQIQQATGRQVPDPKGGLDLEAAAGWFELAREAQDQKAIRSSSNKAWLDEDSRALLHLLTKKNERGQPIIGYSAFSRYRAYHSPRRDQDLVKEIYGHLTGGKVVILDLSVGNPEVREQMSDTIARGIFENSLQIFVAGKTPPHIVAYVEEAHNLIGRKHELTDIWPRIAKEGAKYRLALVYATQEPSSVHPNILANTENWFVTHLNNESELKQISKFYDFGDFSRSLIRAQDVGFARVKTLSGPFVIPVQIDLFDPEAEKARQTASGVEYDAV